MFQVLFRPLFSMKLNRYRLGTVPSAFSLKRYFYLYGSDGGGGRLNLGLSLRSRCDEDGPLLLREAAEDITLPVVPKPILFILLTSGVLRDRAS